MAEIVILQHDAAVRERWLEVLAEKGHHVRAYAVPEDGLDAIAASPPSLVILDLELRDTCALDLIVELRRDFGPARLPIMAVSESEQEQDMRGAFNAGANDYLVRPVGPMELSSKVHLHLRNTQRLKKITLNCDYLPGELICGKYLVEETLGEGSYGVVYAAREMESGEEAAVKILTSETPIDRSRFLRECYTLASLEHPGVVRVLDFGEEEGTVFLAMERISGITLEDWLRRRGVATEAEIWELLFGVVGALEALEAGGVIHRDLKPSNIMLRGDRLSDPILIDFGLAKRTLETGLTSPNLLLGTPGYMPPELLKGGLELDSRGDLFSLGLVARFLATGLETYPHLAGYPLLERMASSPVHIPSCLRPPLRRLLKDLTAIDRDERVGSALELRARLLACAAPARSQLSA